MACKVKTNRSAAKRFKVTGSGKVKFTKANRRHLLTGKTSKLKRQARSAGYMHPGNARAAKAILGLVS